ncbi:MAG: putative bifunctional diguanylate cyclase/phosphodiesterase [Bacillota bacterium]
MDDLKDVPKPKEISPEYDSFKIAFLYLIIAGLWITFSDQLVFFLFGEGRNNLFAQIYKGLFFVSLTSFLLYVVLKKRILSYRSVADKLYQSYNELESTTEELMATEVELEEKIEELKKGKAKIYQQAYYDQLTGLPGKNMLMEQVQQRTGSDASLYFLMLDLDDFKKINDYHGHKFGDELLKELARKFSYSIDEKVEIYRLGGDEFGFLLEPTDNKRNLQELIQQIQDLFAEPFIINGHHIFSSCSMGIVSYPDYADSALELLKKSETAMYRAKEKGKNIYEFYQPEMEQEIAEHLQLDKDLREALSEEQFELFYQPIYDLAADRIISLEALIRWQKPGEGYIRPAQFIPFAEKIGLINAIGNWVIEEVCRQRREWDKLGYQDIEITFNVSARQINEIEFYHTLEAAIAECEIKPENLMIEITESVIMENFESNIDFLKKITRMGVKISLDDFGTGYSSLNYLLKLPINNLKIDKSFIDGISQNKKQDEIISSIIDLAKVIGLDVIVEGIETREQLELIKQKNADQGQGYYLARPQPAVEIDKLLLNQTNSS